MKAYDLLFDQALTRVDAERIHHAAFRAIRVAEPVTSRLIGAHRTGPVEAMGLTFQGMVDLFSEESAIKRPNTVEEVAAMAVLLASDAGAGITGAMLSVSMVTVR